MVKSLVKETPGDGQTSRGGYGFVIDAADGTERFFHARDVDGRRFDQLTRHQQVEYDGYFDETAAARGKGNGQRARALRPC